MMAPWLGVVLAPLAGAIVAGCFAALGRARLAQIAATAGMVVAAACAISVFMVRDVGVITLAEWIRAGDISVAWSIRADALSAVMALVVAGVSALVHIYSWGYMREDPRRGIFFAQLSLFTFMMLALVTANDFVQLFFGWEGVGLASYLLIRHDRHRAAANAAAIKAFVVNRVGDLGLVLGLATLFFATGTLTFDGVFAALPALEAARIDVAGMSLPALETAAALLFVGAMGKSAQFLLHTWLPDAMEGPTPVSALIHAATMVTAGVFLVARCAPIYEAAPSILALVALVGGITALFAASIALVQNDIKRVIAWSTCSQLGYMFVAMGVGAFEAGMFHLFTHAAFKATLFLGAGSVILAAHHEQDMRNLGGLARRTPLTWIATVIGSLALVGVPLTSGYVSKHVIVETAWAVGDAGAGWTGMLASFGAWAGIAAAGLTGFYAARLVFLTFHGTPSPVASKAQESPWVMTIPLLTLAVASIAALAMTSHFVGVDAAAFWGEAGSSEASRARLLAAADAPPLVGLGLTGIGVIGVALAAAFYMLRSSMAAALAQALPAVRRFLLEAWHFDALYNALFVRGAMRLGRAFWRGIDVGVIDRFGPNGAAAVATFASARVAGAQSGRLRRYLLVLLAGAALAMGWALWGPRP